MSKSRAALVGTTAVITGAASGIGYSLAQRLSHLGSPVAIADIDEEGLNDMAASLSGPVLTRVLDVRDADAVTDFAETVRSWAPAPLGAVFNNAGVAVSSSVLESVPADDDWLWNINFRGVVNGTRAFLPILSAQNAGAIVNTSSVFGLAGIANQSAYCSAKFAVRGFTESLRHELRGTGVTATTVLPGGINTNIVRNGRFHSDPQNLGRSRAQITADFAARAMTQPDKAAEIIYRGVQAGKARILVGPDAHVFDLLTRLTPTHYFDVLLRFEALLSRARLTQAVTPDVGSAALLSDRLDTAVH